MSANEPHRATKKLLVLFGLTSVVALANFITVTLAQNTQTTSNKADQNLKSTVRVNPVTLAMEFSLPLGEYPGRGGNSKPISLNYSSKVWTMKKVNYRFEAVQTNENPAWYDYKAYVSTDVGATYGDPAVGTGGWTTTLHPPVILGGFEDYNQNGELLDSFVPENFSDEPPEGGEGEICMQVEPNVTVWVSHPMCGNGVLVLTGDMCCNYTVINGWTCHAIQGTVTGYCYYPLPSPMPTPTPPITPEPSPPVPQTQHHVPRVRVQMPDGSSVEFRKGDRFYNCANEPENCVGENSGTYLSVDGSGMRLERQVVVQPENELRDVLYLPNGSKYIFPLPNGQSMTTGIAERFVDANGNTSTYNASTRTWTDTLGREILNPISNPFGIEPNAPGTQSYTLKGIDNENLTYSLVWSELEDAFEVPATMATKKVGEDSCLNELPNPVSGAYLFANQPVMSGDDYIESWVKYIRRTRMCASPLGWGHVAQFNPIVLAGITYPNGQKYQFKYNEFGEITKIIYPTGGYERFVYDRVIPMGSMSVEVYAQANRGVKERYVSVDGVSEEPTPWSYTDNVAGVNDYGTTTTAPDGSKTERVLHNSTNSGFGFEEPRAGRIKEERVRDTSGALRSRTLTEWIVTPAEGSGAYSPATRDPRPVRSISIMFEGDKILATMSETDYETPGENGSTAPTDQAYFARLNARQTKSYHYLELTSSEANAAYATAIVNLRDKFHNQGQIASAGQTAYSYSADYKSRGLVGLATEKRVMNPSNLSATPLAKTQTVYDNALPAASSGYSYSMLTYGTDPSMDCSDDPEEEEICWRNPNGSSGNIDLSLRGLATTTRVWNGETSSWIESHTRYDQFGNAVKIKDPIDNETTTEFSSLYKYAYPTKVIAPAPDPNNTGHGTNLTSKVETTYDFTTGLPLSVKDDFDQITTTEYDDFLRPFRINPVFVNGSATGPKTETVYGVVDANGQLNADQRFVKVRKQLDATNWDEATTYFDGLGRTIKTVAKDSQGDVIVETHYDNLGRVDRVTNPYRAGETVYWNKTRYDEMGRAVETYAPETLANLANAQSLGVTSFAISPTGEIGTVVTTTDASGRKGRSITNALGQLIRVDEPTAVGGTADADLGEIDNPIQPTSYTYDAYGKMVKVVQGVQTRYFKYDSLGRLLRVNQPEQERNSNLDLSDSFNSSGYWTAGFVYDVLGNVVRATDANGANIINEYDKASRVTKRCYTKPNVNTTVTTCAQIATNDQSIDTPTVTFWYDGKGITEQSPTNWGKGKLTKVTSSVSETQNTLFDNFGRITESRQITDGNTYTSKYTYNLSGALVEEEYPSGRKVKNEFEPDGDLLRIFGKAGHATATEQTYANTFSYTPDGKIERLKLGNGLWERAAFNNRLQVTELNLGHGLDGDMWKLGYQYGEIDANGNVETAKNTGNIARLTLSFSGLSQPFVQSYKYDELYRLGEARETAGSGGSAPQTWKQTFDYDRYGNRIDYDRWNGTTPVTLDNITFPQIEPTSNRFSANQGYSFDKNGNLTVDAESRGFAFNGDNKQIKVTQNGDNVAEYFFDGEGKRVKKKVYDPNTPTVVIEETIFVYSSGKLIAEYSTKPPPPNPTTSYTATDMLGSPRVLTNALGEITSRRDFLPFGEQVEPESSYRTAARKYVNTDDIRQKFTGYQKDEETKLDFAEARMYENRHARFTAIDPLLASGKSANPQTFNRYVYVINNPLVHTDPSGMQIGSYTGRIYYNRDNGAFGNKEFADAYPELGLTPYNGRGIIVAGSGGYLYRLESFSATELGIPGAMPLTPRPSLDQRVAQFENNHPILSAVVPRAFIEMCVATKNSGESLNAQVKLGMQMGDFMRLGAIFHQGLNSGPVRTGGMVTNSASVTEGNTPRQVLQGITDKVSSDVAKNPDLLKTVLSPAQYRAGQNNAAVARMNYGKGIERLIAGEVADSPAASRMFRYLGGKSQPDFVGVGNRLNFDITTPREVAAHLRRPLYGEGLLTCTYERPGGFTTFR